MVLIDNNSLTVFDEISHMIAAYKADREELENIANYMSSISKQFKENKDNNNPLNHFFNGNYGERHSNNIKAFRFGNHPFDVKNAIASLNSYYWEELMTLTGVKELMPQSRVDEWTSTIINHTAPEFEESTVRLTVDELMSLRGVYLSERVDGLYRQLSRNHLTNRPHGFSKRMIVDNVFDLTNNFYSANSTAIGHINDLRSVIALFKGEKELKHGSTSELIRHAAINYGTDYVLDDGSLNMKCYKKGTVHLLVSKEMAKKLNAILHMTNPNAIPRF